MRAQQVDLDIIANRIHPPLTRKERIGFGICMAVCVLIGGLLAIGGWA